MIYVAHGTAQKSAGDNSHRYGLACISTTEIGSLTIGGIAYATSMPSMEMAVKCDIDICNVRTRE